jgi:hypothetical protein
VDHLTTLDPHPLNNDGFDDTPLYSVVDATATTYENVLFSDNYFQTIYAFAIGKAIPGAYTRQLVNLDGGYGFFSGGDHSDVHLWYHGTLDLMTPTTDTGATIGTTQRQSWWTTAEDEGAGGGFYWSRIAGGDRLSTAEPAGAGNGRIRDGYNQRWDLGAGQSDNRTNIVGKLGEWPNVIQLNITGPNELSLGQSTVARFYYQHGLSSADEVGVRLFLDEDLNPYNSNQHEVSQNDYEGTGSDDVQFVDAEIAPEPGKIDPGVYALFARIDDGTHTRYLYAPEQLTVSDGTPAPILGVIGFDAGAFELAVTGQEAQRIILHVSPDLETWMPVATNVLGAAPWHFVDTQSVGLNRRFYQAEVAP